MRTRAALGISLLVVAASACKSNESAAPAPATPTTTAASATSVHPLASGDHAADFRLQGSDGKVHALADHEGKQVVVVAWFPKAFTGG